MKISKRLQVHFRRSTKALEDKNFRLFFFGQVISHSGTWINSVAMGWLVYRLTGSATLLGALSFASQFPAFIVSPFAGVQVDRMNKKRVLQVTLALSAFQSLLLGFLTITDVITVEHLIMLGIFQAIVDGFYLPARHSFITELVSDKSKLGNAIALNAVSFHFARLVGPAIGGILVHFVGEGSCFLIDGISFIVIFCTLFLIYPIRTITARASSGTVLQDLSDGIQYIRYTPRVRLYLTFVAFICLVGISHTVLLPVLVHDVFNGQASSLGILLSASGFGSFIGAIMLALKGREVELINRIKTCSILLPVGIIALSFCNSIYLSLPVLVICGYSFISIAAGSNTLIQYIVTDHYRGRVMSFFAMCFTGMMPIGAAGSGLIADMLGIQNAFKVFGLFALLGSSAFLVGLKKTIANESSSN